MHDTFLLPNTLLFLILWSLSIALLYYIIKTAVMNGVRQANEGMIQSIREIKKPIYEMRKAKE